METHSLPPSLLPSLPCPPSLLSIPFPPIGPSLRPSTRSICSAVVYCVSIGAFSTLMAAGRPLSPSPSPLSPFPPSPPPDAVDYEVNFCVTVSHLREEAHVCVCVSVCGAVRSGAATPQNQSLTDSALSLMNDIINSSTTTTTTNSNQT